MNRADNKNDIKMSYEVVASVAASTRQPQPTGRMTGYGNAAVGRVPIPPLLSSISFASPHQQQQHHHHNHQHEQEQQQQGEAQSLLFPSKTATRINTKPTTTARALGGLAPLKVALSHQMLSSAPPQPQNSLNIRPLRDFATAAVAPVVSSFSEQHEMNTLAPEVSIPQPQQQKQLQNLKIQMGEAIEMISQEEKQAYLEAKRRAPELVDTETDFLQFLRRCNFNVHQAANRICLYWKERKALFGPERAFLPLIITGDGALTREDVLTLKAGFPSLLPDSTTGRKVIYWDRGQFMPSATCDHRLRCIFYIMCFVARDEKTQTKEGAILSLHLGSAPHRFRDLDSEMVRRKFYLDQNVFPVHMQYYGMNFPAGVHNHRATFAIQTMFVNLVEAMMQGLGNDVEVPRLNMHFEREPGDLLALMLGPELNLTRQGIPLVYGGEWSFERSAEWCRKQAERERAQYPQSAASASAKGPPLTVAAAPAATTLPPPRPASTRKRCAADTSAADCKRRSTTATSVAGPTSSSSDEKNHDAVAVSKYSNPTITEADVLQTTEERKRRLRERNLINSRRKRERRKQELKNLKDECDQLQGEKEALQAEEQRLVGLLKQAQHCILVSAVRNTNQPSATPTSGSFGFY